MKGICFIQPLFNAVVEGRKMQTRRVCIPQPHRFENTNFTHIYLSNGDLHIVEGGEVVEVLKPRYKIGETLYLKEPYCFEYGDCGELHYKYAGKDEFDDFKLDSNSDFSKMKWKNKLFMPEKFARYFIEITGVRCERLQDISGEDCLKEGIIEMDWECASDIHSHLVNSGNVYGWDEDCNNGNGNIEYSTPQQAFAALINSIEKGTWEQNPYVWVYDFKLKNKVNRVGYGYCL